MPRILFASLLLIALSSSVVADADARRVLLDRDARDALDLGPSDDDRVDVLQRLELDIDRDGNIDRAVVVRTETGVGVALFLGRSDQRLMVRPTSFVALEISFARASWMRVGAWNLLVLDDTNHQRTLVGLFARRLATVATYPRHNDLVRGDWRSERRSFVRWDAKRDAFILSQTRSDHMADALMTDSQHHRVTQLTYDGTGWVGCAIKNQTPTVDVRLKLARTLERHGNDAAALILATEALAHARANGIDSDDTLYTDALSMVARLKVRNDSVVVR